MVWPWEDQIAGNKFSKTRNRKKNVFFKSYYQKEKNTVNILPELLKNRYNIYWYTYAVDSHLR
jgi:hypothetical protein